MMSINVDSTFDHIVEANQEWPFDINTLCHNYNCFKIQETQFDEGKYDRSYFWKYAAIQFVFYFADQAESRHLCSF